jgi:trafficking protein particle complex subunit 11
VDHQLIDMCFQEFLLPPRKARLPDDYEKSSSAPVLHSPFSPLSTGSTTYPDGLIDTEWLRKHQELIPSICLSFYNLTSDPNLATLHDNQLKTDINAIKNAISQPGYKCRLAVVLLCDQSPSTMSGYQERLENIRKSTGLDPKASLFVLPTIRSESDIEIAVDNVLGAVFTQASEYYRDLGRHARKKKGRGIAPQPTVPPTTGTSHTLTLQGWNVRYDFKSGVLAEFRQETDGALRFYEQAYEALIGPDVMESIPGWTPRFNDARLLADVIAIRAIRCLMWMGQSTAAVRRWQAHRSKMADLVDRIGRGTQNYGWHAWEATWAEMMANMVERVGFSELNASSSTLFKLPEKTLSAERLQPWELLHHQGYWYHKAAQHSMDRRTYALAIPEDDREMPDVSAGTKSAATYTAYDSYLCQPPYEEFALNHGDIIIAYLSSARMEFQKRRQSRLVAVLLQDHARELERMRSWKPLLELLTPLWRSMAFRAEGWWDISESISLMLKAAAIKAGNAELVVAIDWELLNSREFTSTLRKCCRDCC